MTADVSPLKVLWLSDGKPGHFSLAEAIIAALARRRAVAVTRAEVARPSMLPPRVLSGLSNARAPGLARLCGLDLSALPPTDIVVSAGGDTLAANVAAARHFGAPNVFYGSLRRYRPVDFTLVLTSYAEHATRPNTVMTLKPSARDPGDMPRPGAQPAAIGVLVGGDSGTIRFRREDWDRLSALIKDAAAAGHRVTIANSRRTPADVSDRLAAIAAAGGTVGFLDVRSAGPGTLGPLLAASDAILATVDSSSMISEAVWARRPVLVVAPEHWQLPPLEAGYRAWMERSGWTRSLPIADVSPRHLPDLLAALTPIDHNPLDHLAALLAERLPAVCRLDQHRVASGATVFKITTLDDYEAARRTGVLAMSSDDLRDGFTHLSARHQVSETARRYFARRSGLCLMAFAESDLGDALKWEPSRGGDLFPHYYGLLPVSAALWARPLPLGDDGVPDIAAAIDEA